MDGLVGGVEEAAAAVAGLEVGDGVVGGGGPGAAGELVDGALAGGTRGNADAELAEKKNAKNHCELFILGN